MRKLLISCLSIFLFVHSSLLLTVHATEETDFDVRPTLYMALEQLDELESFQIELKLENLDDNQTVAEGTLYANQLDETFGVWLDYYIYSENEDVTPVKIPIVFYGYNQMNLAYINYPESLNDLLHHQEELLDFGELNQLKVTLEDFKDTMIEIHLNDKNRNGNPLDFSKALVLKPNEKSLDKLELEEIEYYRGNYHFNVQRVGIPDGLLQTSGYFHLDVDFDTVLETLLDEASTTHYHLETNSNYAFDGSSSGLSLHFSNGLSLADAESVTRYNPLRRERDSGRLMHDFYFNLDLKNVMSKPTLIDFNYHPRNQHLRLVMEGISEEFALNLFESQTANFKTTHLRLTYELSPTQISFPEFDSFKKLTVPAWEYLVNQKFKP